jgi:hypothetical protein
MKKILTFLFYTVAFITPFRASAGDFSSTTFVDSRPSAIDADQQKAYRTWKLSLIPLATSQAMDISSSYGLRELNPALADPNGRFGMQSAATKIGITAGIAGVEYLIVRKHPAAAKFLWKMNLGGAAATAGVAMHNYTLR